MGNFREKLIRFMYGRYGTDQLYYVTTIFCFVLMLVNAFIQSDIISLLVWIILVWMIFRTFSRNISRRSMENQRFLKLWNPIKRKASLTIQRFKEIKTHRYRKCPQCKAVLRLPRRTGRHTVECPSCRHEFHVHVRW